MRRATANRLTALGLALVVVLLCNACQDWAQFGGDAALTGNASGETIISSSNVSTLSEAYTIPLPGGPSTISTEPVVAAGIVYAGTSDGRLLAASADTRTNCSGTPKVCQPLWTASLPGMTQSATPLVSGQVVYDTFVDTTSGTPSGELAAFDATGTIGCGGNPKVCQPLWSAPVTSLASPNLDGGRIFVDDIASSSVKVIDASGVTDCSGSPKVCQPLWTDATPAVAEPTVADGQVFVTRDDAGTSRPGQPASVDVYDESGTTNCAGSPEVCQPVWTVALPGAPAGSVSVSDDLAFVWSSSPLFVGGVLVAFHPTGTDCPAAVCQPEWTGGAAGPPSQVVGAPAVDDDTGMAYLAGSDGLVAYDKEDGSCSGIPSSCVSFQGDTQSAGLHTPIVTNGLLIAGDEIFDAAGNDFCDFVPEHICSPMVVLPGITNPSVATVSLGTLLIGGSGAIHAFQLP